MLSNNYAISSALSGDFNESINTLLYLSEEVNIRKEIIYYNLSQIYLLKNDNTLYEKYLLLSYNFDKNTYRIKNSFRSYLLSIKSSNDIFKIDIKDIINKNYYDHCHMDKIGHISLADKISNLSPKTRTKSGFNKSKASPKPFKPSAVDWDKPKGVSDSNAKSTL